MNFTKVFLFKWTQQFNLSVPFINFFEALQIDFELIAFVFVVIRTLCANSTICSLSNYYLSKDNVTHLRISPFLLNSQSNQYTFQHRWGILLYFKPNYLIQRNIDIRNHTHHLIDSIESRPILSNLCSRRNADEASGAYIGAILIFYSVKMK